MAMGCVGIELKESDDKRREYWDREILKYEGRIYRHVSYFREKYAVDKSWIACAKRDGMPWIHKGRETYINEEDFHDYCAGKIGGDVHGYERVGRPKKQQQGLHDVQVGQANE